MSKQYFAKNNDVDSSENRGSNPFVIREGRFNSLRDSSNRSGWTEDSFLTNASHKETIGKTFDFSKLRYIIFFFLFLLLILVVRVGQLQIVEGAYYRGVAEGNRIRIKRIEPQRGIIYDRDLNPLVQNIANFILYIVPIDLPKDPLEQNNIIRRVSMILDDADVSIIKTSEKQENIEVITDTPSFYDIKEKLSTIDIGSLESYQPLFIVDNIDHEKAMLLSLEADSIPGVVISNKTKRDYFFDSDSGSRVTVKSLSHLLGYIGKISVEELDEFGDEYSPIDYIGKSGIEYFWENELKGINGRKHIEVDALGKEKKIISQDYAEDGHNLVLTIDAQLQKKVEDILTSYLERLNKKRASVILMNPNNGEILSLVSLPAYNNNDFSAGISVEKYTAYIQDQNKPLFNRAISGEFPSGSTFKPVISAAALQEGVINEHTSFLSVGGIYVGQWFFPDWKAGGHGITNVRKAIAQSVNTFFYNISGGHKDFKGLGIDKIVKYAKLFGLGAQTGIDLIGEADGLVPTPEWKQETKDERWYIGDTYHVGIGQGDILVTPIQVANFTSVFANGGKLYRPHLVKTILINDEIFREIETPPTKENFIDSYNIEIVRQGMRQTITNGSARLLQSVPVAVAGKTGTAQWSSQKSDHAWFTGFAPFEKPEIVITVLVEEGGEGSSVAVPIANEILQYYFSQ